MMLTLLRRAALTLGAVSAAIPAIAAWRQDPSPSPLFVSLDLGLAGLWVSATLLVTWQARDRLTLAAEALAGRWVRGGASIVLVLLPLYFFSGLSFDWNVLIVGWAWRGWLLAYASPYFAATA